MRPTCETCDFFDREHEPEDGLCTFRPPPIVISIYAALQGEPGTRIDWEKLLDQPHRVSSSFGCDLHKLRP